MFEQMARFGYGSKAVVYAIVGSLALAAAANRGGRITARTDSRAPYPEGSTVRVSAAADRAVVLEEAS